MARISYIIDDSTISQQVKEIKDKVLTQVADEASNPNSDFSIRLGLELSRNVPTAQTSIVKDATEKLQRAINETESEYLVEVGKVVKLKEDLVALGERFQNAVDLDQNQLQQIGDEAIQLRADLAISDGRAQELYNTLQEDKATLASLLEESRTLQFKLRAMGQQIIEYDHKLQAAGSIISLGVAGLQTYRALSKKQDDIQIQLMFTAIQNIVQMATVYSALGASSGNLAMVAAAGGALSSVATMINTVNSIQERVQSSNVAEDRRLQNLRQ